MLDARPYRVVGTMSGTSLDGVDAAEIVTDGETIFGFGDSHYRPYSTAERAVLTAALGKWPEDDLSEVAALIAQAHIAALRSFEQAEMIGFHGQTLAHDPGGRGTHQCGDGAALAAACARPVVWDFRSADVQLGGQGAPLAPFYHFALAKWIGVAAPIAFLNLGGVGNITWVDPSAPTPDTPGALLACDTGPANAPINDLMQARCGTPYDAEGAQAAKGTPNDGILTSFFANPFFSQHPPKSLDRDAFAALTQATANLSTPDAAATLTAAAAGGVARALAHCPSLPSKLLVTGGGRKNPTLMKMLAAECPCPIAPVEDAGLDGDMLEAQAFAYLAVRVARGLPTSCPGTTGVPAAVSGGTVTQPAPQ